MQETANKKIFLFRLVIAVIIIAVVLLSWSGMVIAVQRQATWFDSVFDRGFGLLLLVSYVGICGVAIALSRNFELALNYVLMFSITIFMCVALLEIPSAMGLVSWSEAFKKIENERGYYIAFRYDSDLAFRRIENARWSGRPRSDMEKKYFMPASIDVDLIFTYDKWGYRNPPDLERSNVVLVGDSYIEGSYVSDNQTVARRLASYIGGPVGNLGVAGYGSRQQLIVLQRDAPLYQPEVVIWFFFEGNDLYDDAWFENFTPELQVQESRKPSKYWKTWKRRSFAFSALNRVREWVHRLLPTKPSYVGRLSLSGKERKVVYFHDYAGVPWDDWVRQQWNKTEKILKKGIALSHDRGYELILAFVPIKYRVLEPFIIMDDKEIEHSWSNWPIDSLFMKFCEREHITCLELTSVFQESFRRGGMPYALNDSHWSAEGHDLVARELAVLLREKGWLRR